MNRIARAATCLLIGLAGAGLAKEKASADDLIHSMNKAVAKIGKQAKAGVLNPGESKHKGFLACVKKLSREIDDLEASCLKKEEKFFRHMCKVGESVATVEVCWTNCALSDAGIGGAVQKLVQDYQTLRKLFGPEAIRKKKKQALDDDDKKKIAELKKQNAELKAKLEKLQGQVKGEPALAKAVAGFLTDLGKLLTAEWTLDTYCDLMIMEESLLGHWTGWYVEVEVLYPAFVDEFQVVTPCFVEIEHDYVEVVEEVEIVETDWVVVTTDVEVEITLEVEGITDAEVETCEAFVEEIEVQVDVEVIEEEAPGDDHGDDEKMPPGGDDDDD